MNENHILDYSNLKWFHLISAGMQNSKFSLRNELERLKNAVSGLDRKVVIIFIAVAVLQTISWYYTSRRFFRFNIFPSYSNHPDIYLIEYLFWFIGDFITFFILPLLIIKFIHKEKISSYGLTLGDKLTGVTLTVIFLAVMLPVIWIFSSQPSFVAKYPHLLSVREVWDKFFVYELGMLIYMFAWEFIWRGYMLFGLEEKFGYYAVLIQMIPFVILHNGKPVAETFGAILGGIALGILALRTRSIIYGVVIHMGIMFSIDLICSLRFRAGDYGIGISSIINVVKQLF